MSACFFAAVVSQRTHDAKDGHCQHETADRREQRCEEICFWQIDASAEKEEDGIDANSDFHGGRDIEHKFFLYEDGQTHEGDFQEDKGGEFDQEQEGTFLQEKVRSERTCKR